MPPSHVHRTPSTSVPPSHVARISSTSVPSSHVPRCPAYPYFHHIYLGFLAHPYFITRTQMSSTSIPPSHVPRTISTSVPPSHKPKCPAHSYFHHTYPKCPVYPYLYRMYLGLLAHPYLHHTCLYHTYPRLLVDPYLDSRYASSSAFNAYGHLMILQSEETHSVHHVMGNSVWYSSYMCLDKPPRFSVKSGISNCTGRDSNIKIDSNSKINGIAALPSLHPCFYSGR